MDQVNYTYQGREKEVLRRLCLKVEPGENVGIIGDSGGGKSTLLKIISGLYETQSGMVRVAGETRPVKIRSKVAMVMQAANLFPVSIRDNITCVHKMSNEEIWEACEAAQISQWIESLEDGLDTKVGERGQGVSGGQAQRIAIARAIAKKSPVILLDEPTSAIDEVTRKALLTAISRLTIGKTVIHVSHQTEALRGCDRIYRLVEGVLRLL